jgi:hypothetical protein
MTRVCSFKTREMKFIPHMRRGTWRGWCLAFQPQIFMPEASSIVRHPSELLLAMNEACLGRRKSRKRQDFLWVELDRLVVPKLRQDSSSAVPMLCHMHQFSRAGVHVAVQITTTIGDYSHLKFSATMAESGTALQDLSTAGQIMYE